ncbi:MAG: xanthine dehydrogenase family protein, partial [Pseudomonadota bacterium]
MTKFGVSQSVLRKEDSRFLTGAGRYVDDIAPAGALIVHFFRSPVAHATVTELDVSEARAADGVVAVYTAADLTGKVKNAMDFSVVTNRDGSKGASPVRPLLAEDRVCHAGEALAAIVATSRQAALDAAELIVFDFDERPTHIATALGGEAIHTEAPDNRAFDWAYGDEAATAAAFDTAAHRITLDLIDNRVFANPMEPRGCYAEMEEGRLHVAVNGQGVWGLKGEIARKLGMPKDDIRVTNPDVGGGFGMKSFNYPEYFVIAHAARDLGQPIRWMAERSEGHLTDAGGRDIVTTAEAAFDADHKLTALRVHSVPNMGAYNSQYAQFIQSELALKVLTGVYDVQTVFFHVEGVYTNTTPIDAYRGAGRPEAIYVMERLMDYAARQLGLDPVELRRKNFIPREAFPYTSASGELYDVGDFHRVLDRAMEEADVAGFSTRRAESAKAGKLRGIGLSYYIESILGDQNETTKIEFAEDGLVNLYVGTQSN